MRVSVIIPACDAQDTLAAAVASLLAQDHADWEGIVVADDRRDYAALLEASGIADRRLRFTATGGVRTGCHRARNVGLAIATGAFVTQLDADDAITPTRLSTLLPVAAEHGAAADNLQAVAAADGALLDRPMRNLAAPARLDMAAFFALSMPLVPLVRRDHAQPRTEGVEFAEDVVANMQLIGRIGALPVLPQASYLYRIGAASMCNDPQAEAAFDAAYAAYEARLAAGDGFGLPAALRPVAQAGFAAKRALNAAFAEARRAEPDLAFQDFAARR